jgi:hypothetical protein
MQFGPFVVFEAPLCFSISLVIVTKTSFALKMHSAISDCTACPFDRKCLDCTVSIALSRDTQLHGIAPTHGARRHTGSLALSPVGVQVF